MFPQNLLNLPIAMLEVSSSLHTLLGWGGKVGGGGGGVALVREISCLGMEGEFFYLLKQVLFGNEMAL